MMLKVRKMRVPHGLLAALLHRALCRRNGTDRCGCMSPRVLDLVEVCRITCGERWHCDGDPSQVPFGLVVCAFAAKNLVQRLTT